MALSLTRGTVNSSLPKPKSSPSKPSVVTVTADQLAALTGRYFQTVWNFQFYRLLCYRQKSDKYIFPGTEKQQKHHYNHSSQTNQYNIETC
jgi:hypothetical protein